MEVIQNIRQARDLVTNLNGLGTQLRDPVVRENPEVFELIPKLLHIYQVGLQDLQDLQNFQDENQVKLEILRVLVNWTADSDKNRSELITYNGFWDAVRGDLEGNIAVDRILILLTQFIKNTDQLQLYMNFFYGVKFYEPLFPILALSEDVNMMILEFLGELLVPEMIISDPQFKAQAEEYLSLLITLYEELEQRMAEEDEEELEDGYFNLSVLMYNLTQYHDLGTAQMVRIYPLFDKFTSNSKINRQLFSTVGNLSLMQQFDDIDQISTLLQQNWISQTNNLYLKGSYYLMIGNYINSEAKHKEILALIGNPDIFIKEYFDNNFTDIIQFQSIHLIKNLMNQSLALVIINHGNLINYCKILSDNQNYYKEIYQTFIKFWTKLIPLSFPGLSIYDHSQYWNMLNNPEINMKLSPFVESSTTEDSKSLNSTIIRDLFLIDLPLESHKLLDKIKYQAIFLQKNHQLVYETYSKEDFNPKFLKELNKLLQLLTDSSKDSNDYKILLNNSKFISISLLKLQDQEIANCANQILSLPDI